MSIIEKQTLPIARYHIIWAAFYILLLGASAAFAGYLYIQHDEDRLPAGYIELMLDKQQYQLADTVAFTVTNHFPTTVYITNHCPKEPLNVYQWKSDVWVQLHAVANEDGDCYGQERNVAIPPEGSRGYNFNDWPTLFAEPGVYRIAMVVQNYSEVPFQDFVVLAPPETIVVEKPVTVPPVIPPTVPSATEPIVVDVPEPDVVVTPVAEDVLDQVFEEEQVQEQDEHDEREWGEEDDD